MVLTELLELLGACPSPNQYVILDPHTSNRIKSIVVNHRKQEIVLSILPVSEATERAERQGNHVRVLKMTSMKTKNPEVAFIRSQLKLRKDELTNTWEVYTTIHGSGVFRWFKISHERAEWYKENFQEIRTLDTNVSVPDSGAIINPSDKLKEESNV